MVADVGADIQYCSSYNGHEFAEHDIDKVIVTTLYHV